MPAQIASQRLIPGAHVEIIDLVSPLGAKMQLQIHLKDSDLRKQMIDDGIAALDALDAEMVRYAQTHGLPIPDCPVSLERSAS